MPSGRLSGLYRGGLRPMEPSAVGDPSDATSEGFGCSGEMIAHGAAAETAWLPNDCEPPIEIKIEPAENGC